ncbi:MAG: hypothetical protein AB7O37_07780 [Vicinamibacteria bacterium]
MNVEAEIDALYASPLAGFVEARNGLAARLRAAGQRDEAQRVKALARPSAGAWAVNRIFWTRREALQELLASHQGLRSAHEAGEPAALREAARRRRDALQALLKTAETELREAGHGTPPALLKKVSDTLEALVAQGGDAVAGAGRLTAELDPPGFDAIAGVAVAPRRVAQAGPPAGPLARASGAGGGRPSDDPEAARREAAGAALRDEATRLRRRLMALRDEAAVASKRLEAARAEQAEAAQRLQRAEERHAAARQADVAAREALAAEETALARVERELAEDGGEA